MPGTVRDARTPLHRTQPYCSVCGQLLDSKPSELNEILKSNPDIMQQIITEVTKNVEKRMRYQKLAEERFKVMTDY